MQGLRFNHVFTGLLLLCAISAFFLPRFVDPARAQVQNIFAPVSKPAAGFAQWIHHRISRAPSPDEASPDQPRPDSDIRSENAELRQIVASLTAQLEKLQEREAEYKQLGKLRNLCSVFTVSAGDTGSGETLVISGTSLDHLKPGMAVVYPGGLAGQLQTPGLTGTRVRLISDKGFSMTGIFARYVKGADGRINLVRVATDPPLVRGNGDNTLIIDGMSLDKANDVQVNDWVLLDDSGWPLALQGQPLGRVVAAPGPSPRAPGFAEIRLQPAAELMRLRELMVVTKAKY